MENSGCDAYEEQAAGGRRRRPGRPRVSRVLLVLGGAGAALALAAATTTASGAGKTAQHTRHGARGAYESAADPVLGSWYAQVHFPGAPFPGRTEATMMTFVPGGGLVEANPINESPAANSGYWKRNPDGTYHLRLLNFTWNPATSGIKQVLDVDITFALQGHDRFQSSAASALVYFYDSQTGQRLADPTAVPNVTVTTAQRLDQWTVPASFPAEP